jgi:hypothetical protein
MDERYFNDQNKKLSYKRILSFPLFDLAGKLASGLQLN